MVKLGRVSAVLARRNCGSSESVGPEKLWVWRKCRSAETACLQKLRVCRNCESAEIAGLHKLWICRTCRFTKTIGLHNGQIHRNCYRMHICRNDNIYRLTETVGCRHSPDQNYTQMIYQVLMQHQTKM